MTRQQLKICAHGLIRPSEDQNIPGYCYPHPTAVNFCKQWISYNCRQSRYWNQDFSSYGLKHVVEDHSRVVKNDGEYLNMGDYLYIPNGAFIQAASDLGYKYDSRKNRLENDVLGDFRSAMFKFKTTTGDQDYDYNSTTVKRRFLNWTKTDHWKIVYTTRLCNDLHYNDYDNTFLKNNDIKRSREEFIDNPGSTHVFIDAYIDRLIDEYRKNNESTK